MYNIERWIYFSAPFYSIDNLERSIYLCALIHRTQTPLVYSRIKACSHLEEPHPCLNLSMLRVICLLCLADSYLRSLSPSSFIEYERPLIVATRDPEKCSNSRRPVWMLISKISYLSNYGKSDSDSPCQYLTRKKEHMSVYRTHSKRYQTIERGNEIIHVTSTRSQRPPLNKCLWFRVQKNNLDENFSSEMG